MEPNETGVIQASEILAEIVSGKTVDYSNILIEGDLDLSNIDLPKGNRVTSPIKITDSTIYGKVDFNNTIMQGPVDFSRTMFLGPAGFIETQFRAGVDFEGAQFNEFAFFRSAQFNSSCNFGKTQFNGSANFLKARFRGDPVNFRKSKFKESAMFWSASFEANPDGTESGLADFDESKFSDFASFKNVTFIKQARFRDSQFNDLADFQSAKFENDADFIGTRFDKNLYFMDAKFSTLYVNWASVENKLVCNGPTYLALIKNFKDLEQTEDADDCYYQYRDWKRNDRPIGWLKVLDYLSWLSCGYGIRWHHTISTALFMAVLFGIYYETRDIESILLGYIMRRNNTKFSLHEFRQKLVKTMSLSIMILLSLPSDWYPYGKDEFAKSIQRNLYSAIFERIVGWGLMLLLIGTLTRLMVRY